MKADLESAVLFEERYIAVYRFLTEIMEQQKLSILPEIIHPEYRAGNQTIIKQLGLFNGENDQNDISLHQRMRKLLQAFDDVHITLTNTIIDDNNVACFFTAEVTHVEYWHTFSATGKRISTHGYVTFHLRENLIIEIDAMLSVIDVIRQLSGEDKAKNLDWYISAVKNISSNFQPETE